MEEAVDLQQRVAGQRDGIALEGGEALLFQIAKLALEALAEIDAEFLLEVSAADATEL